MAVMFPTALRPAAITVNQELVLQLGGSSTVVFMTSAANRSFFGLAAVGGNIDGMVVCLVNISGVLNSVHTFNHDSASASNVINRFVNAGQTNIGTGTGIGAATYRYDGTQQRWMMLSHT